MILTLYSPNVQHDIFTIFFKFVLNVSLWGKAFS